MNGIRISNRGTASVITMNSLSHVDLAFNNIVNRTWKWHDSEVVVLRAGDLDLLISEIQFLDSQKDKPKRD